MVVLQSSGATTDIQGLFTIPLVDVGTYDCVHLLTLGIHANTISGYRCDKWADPTTVTLSRLTSAVRFWRTVIPYLMILYWGFGLGGDVTLSLNTISGVGPQREQMLQDAGITSLVAFAQTSPIATGRDYAGQ